MEQHVSNSTITSKIEYKEILLENFLCLVSNDSDIEIKELDIIKETLIFNNIVKNNNDVLTIKYHKDENITSNIIYFLDNKLVLKILLEDSSISFDLLNSLIKQAEELNITPKFFLIDQIKSKTGSNKTVFIEELLTEPDYQMLVHSLDKNDLKNLFLHLVKFNTMKIINISDKGFDNEMNHDFLKKNIEKSNIVSDNTDIYINYNNFYMNYIKDNLFPKASIQLDEVLELNKDNFIKEEEGTEDNVNDSVNSHTLIDKKVITEFMENLKNEFSSDNKTPYKDFLNKKDNKREENTDSAENEEKTDTTHKEDKEEIIPISKSPEFKKENVLACICLIDVTNQNTLEQITTDMKEENDKIDKDKSQKKVKFIDYEDVSFNFLGWDIAAYLIDVSYDLKTVSPFYFKKSFDLMEKNKKKLIDTFRLYTDLVNKNYKDNGENQVIKELNIIYIYSLLKWVFRKLILEYITLTNKEYNFIYLINWMIQRHNFCVEKIKLYQE